MFHCSFVSPGAPTLSVEVVEEEEGVFRDNWDYQMEPSRIPLLSDIIRNHTLPPTANGSVSKTKKKITKVVIKINKQK